MRRRGFTLARRIEADLPQPRTTFTVFETDTSQVTRLGLDLVQFDRELRRAAQLFGGTQRTSFGSLPPPLSVREGGMRVCEVDVKSTEALVQAYGVLHDVLLSNPVQLFLAAQALRQNAARVRVWFRRTAPGVSLDGLKEIAQVLRHGPPGEPRRTPGQEAQSQALAVDSGSGGGDPDVRISETGGDGSALSIEMRGHRPSRIRRTRHLREHPDGIEYIEIEEIDW